MAGGQEQAGGDGGATRRGSRLPPAIEQATELLTTRGALTPGELAIALRSQGVVLREDQLGRLPERWPHLFGLDDLGRFTTAVAAGSPGSADDDRPPDIQDRWWEQAADIDELSASSVLVVAVDTTGTDPKRDHLQRIVTVNLGTGENTLIDVAHLDDAAGAEAVATAFEQLDEQLERSDAIAGNLVLRFTVPFLTAVARRAGFEWQTSLPGVDLHSLSLVVDPTLVGRGLTELADHFDVPLAGKGAAARAAATTELLRLMLDRYDPGDPTWALARACLARAEDPIARLLPAGGPIGDLADALRPMPDELATMGDGRRHAGTASAVAAAFATMRAHVPGYRDRPSQRAMADAIAAAMDGGDRLVVEAPTGTGKSLAYLVPAAGRAARPNS